MPIYSIDNAYISYAIGTDLTAWDNAYAALIAGECQATDLVDVNIGQLAVDFSDPETVDYHHMSASQYAGKYTAGYKEAKLALPMYLQTGVFAYATLGTCSTGAGPPYTHSLSLNTSQTPISLAFHFEKELTGQDLRYDFFGFLPDSWNLKCGDDPNQWIAKQIFIGKFAKSDNTASDLAEPSKQTLTNYEWSDLKHASGKLDFVYNSNALEMNVHGFNLTVKRTRPLWGARNSTGYPSDAFISGMMIDLYVDAYITGDNVRTLMETKPEDYAGDLNVDLKFYKSASREFPIDINKMYLVPDKDMLSESNWYEKKRLHFVPYSNATTITMAPEDSLDKTYYEND